MLLRSCQHWPVAFIFLVGSVVAAELERDDSAPVPNKAYNESVPHVGPTLWPGGPQAAPVFTPTQLDSAIQAKMLAYHYRGLSACVVVGDSIVWEGNYGFGDSAGLKPVTDSTLFELASISKTFLANAIMQLYQSGALDLDDNVNDYLPFPVSNPYYPDSVITLRMILAHVSSIARRDETWLPDLCYGFDCPTPLATYLQDYLVTGGSKYNVANFLARPPGDSGLYSNYAFSLLGLVIENASGMSLEQYSQDSLFIPLKMTNTSWFLANLDTADIAMPLYWTNSPPAYHPYGHYGTPIYPIAQVRTSSRQLAHHLSAFLGYGEFDGVRILDSSTIEQMRVTQYPGAPLGAGVEWGLGWYRVLTPGGDWAWGHDGNLNGISTAMYGDVDHRTGIIFVSNGRIYDYPIQQVVIPLWNFSRDLDDDGVVAGMDNCQNTFNPGQEDANNDGVGDACCCLAAVGNIDCDQYDGVDVGDLTALIDNLFIGFAPLCCAGEANCDGSGGVDVGDLTALIDNLFINFTSLSSCGQI